MPVVEPRGNAILVTKQASGSAKSAPLMPAFKAIALVAMSPWSAQRKRNLDLRCVLEKVNC
jgi:hypothetical protein